MRGVEGILLFTLGIILLAIPPLQGYPALWSLTIGSAALAMGSISVLVYSRRLLFAAASAPHSAFFAAALSVIISSSLGGDEFLLTIIIGIFLVYLIGGLAYLGVDPDDATAFVASLSSVGGVLAVFYVMTRISSGGNLFSIIIGDPLLATREEVIAGLIVSLIVLVFGILSAREVVYIGVDRDDAILSGVRVWLYDLILYTLLGIVVMALVRSVGFVMEHVLILLPGAVAATRASSPLDAVLIAGGGTLFAGAVGLILGITFNVSPSGSTGLVILGVYAIHAATRRR